MVIMPMGIRSDLNIYLCGKMSGLTFQEMNTWRLEMKMSLINAANIRDMDINVINPVDYYNFEQKRYQSQLEVMKFDLGKVTDSDLVIANLKDIDTSIGSVIEIYEAYMNNIPVIGYSDSDDDTYTDIHPWIKNCLTRVEESVESVVEYISDFYMS